MNEKQSLTVSTASTDTAAGDSEQPARRGPGGRQPGAGRPAGSTHKLTASQILADAEQLLGKPLHQTILEGYVDTIRDGDRKNRLVYENMLLNKVVAHISTVEIEDNREAVADRTQAFVDALTAVVAAQAAPPLH